MRPTLKSLLAAATALLVLSACAGLPSASTAAIVGDREIPRDRVETAVTDLDLTTIRAGIEAGLPANLDGPERDAAVAAELDAIVAETQRRVVDLLVRFELAALLAEDVGAEVTDADRAESRELLLGSVGGPAGLEEALAQSRLSVELFDEVIVEQEALILAMRRELLAGETLEVRTPRHILVPTEEEALELLAELEAGADFATLARERSQDPGSADAGGDLDAQPRGAWLVEFDDAVWSAEVGDLVGPVQTQAGFHLIEVVSADSLGPDELTEPQAQQLTTARIEEGFTALVEDTEVVIDPAFGSWDADAPGGPVLRPPSGVGVGAARPADAGSRELTQEEVQDLVEELEEDQ